MKFKKIKKIQKVRGFDPYTGIYSTYEPNRIYFHNTFVELEEEPSKIKLIGERIFTRDAAGCLKIWKEGILIETIENADLFSKSDNNQILKYYYDKEWNSYDNILDLETNKLILKESIPYQLYVEKNIIIAYDIFEGEIKRINTDTETLWQFTIASLGDSPYPDEEDRIDKIVGIANGNLWVYTKLYRLVALDIETGCVQYHTDCFGVQLDEVTENIFAIASSGWTIIDTQTFTIKGNYFFSKEDPEGMGQYESVYTPLLQGDYFTFIGSKHKEYGGIGWIGIFDYKARKLVWEHELISEEERKNTRNHLAATQPLYMSGNKLYIKDVKDNLYIFEREE
ncbi:MULTISPECIES: hypothetical protein [unclassified Capnocytophaga]|uniref:hypothetical protein n=1 Tax=unclassified Capnocytophaga TaxID=2640652 RepID=UPI000202D69C|nr:MULTISPECIES: hypothetical protein [unclassified Capnocytophaga]EGD34434.1 hypothetical protein HMPREF9071_1005 [Capnocytophaga sp. oral taxon 338 str. F0234]MEB3005911.1 hypothetical protein [Capnocytophaga sp. G2]